MAPPWIPSATPAASPSPTGRRGRCSGSSPGSSAPRAALALVVSLQPIGAAELATGSGACVPMGRRRPAAGRPASGFRRSSASPATSCDGTAGGSCSPPTRGPSCRATSSSSTTGWSRAASTASTSCSRSSGRASRTVAACATACACRGCSRAPTSSSSTTTSPSSTSSSPIGDVRIVQLWHASGPFKTVGYSRIGKEGGPRPWSRIHKNYTHAIVSSETDVPFYAEAFGIPESRVIPTGIPRMDRYFDPACDRRRPGGGTGGLPDDARPVDHPVRPDLPRRRAA